MGRNSPNSMTHTAVGNGGNDYRRAGAALVLATILWGSTFSFTKVLVAAVPPMYLLGYRFLLAAIPIFLIFRRRIVSEFPRAIRSTHLAAFSLVGICAIGFQTYGIKFTTASNAGFITAFSILLVPILKRYHFGAAVPRRVYTAAVLALAGLYALSFGFAVPDLLNRGDAFVFACAIFYGYYILLLEGLAREFSGATTMFVSFALTAVACFALGVLTETHPPANELLTAAVALELFGLVAFGTVVAYLLMAWGQRHVPAEAAAVIYALEPVFAFLVAWGFLRESLSPARMVGGAVVIFALLVSVRSSEAARNNGSSGQNTWTEKD